MNHINEKMAQLTDTERFRNARTRFRQTTEQVANEFGVSPRYIYEVLKYPNKNRDLYQRLKEYIQRSKEISE